MIRVLHITSSMKRGGIETFLMNVYREIDRTKIQFDFLLTSNEETDYTREIKKLGGEIYFIPSRKSDVFRYKKNLKKFFEQNNEYEIVHQHVSSLTDILPLKIAKQKKVPTRIIHSHNTKQSGSFLHKYIHLWNKLQIKSVATQFYACSKLAAHWLYPRSLYKKEGYKVINNAINVKKFKFNQTIRTGIRKDFQLQSEIIIGNVGRFNKQKNHSFLIKIFNDIHKLNKNTKLILVGDGPLKLSIEDEVKKLDLEDAVIFTGVRSDISELIQMFDIFVMPSFHEGLPVTVIEAQASGLPCVLSKSITKEVEVTKNIKWISLKKTSLEWANEILEQNNLIKRVDVTEDLVESGYEMKNVANDLKNKYLKYYTEERR